MSAGAGVPERRELARKLIHVSYGCCALALRVLPPWGAVALAALGVLHNRWLLPRWGGALLRGGERWPRGGVYAYPLAVLLAVLVFLHRPELAACVWGVLAFGDGLAAIVGRGLGGPRLPWNRAKTFAGSTAYLVAGTLGAAALLAFVSLRSPATGAPFAAALVPAAMAALAAALVESLPLRVDDNLTAALAAMAALGIWTAVDPALLAARAPELAARVLPALVVTAVCALAAWRARAVTVPAAGVGFALAASTWVLGGVGLYAAFAVFFVLAAAATRFGEDRKRAQGVAQDNQGRRGVRHALANTAIPVALTAVAVVAREPGPFLLAAAGGLATAAMDTVAGEVGQVLGRRPVLIGTAREVPVGTEGAISREGTLSGALAALAVAATGSGLGLFEARWIAPVTGFAVAGGLAESAVAARIRRGGPVDNEAMNLLNTAVGAGLCLGAGLLLGVSPS